MDHPLASIVDDTKRLMETTSNLGLRKNLTLHSGEPTELPQVLQTPRTLAMGAVSLELMETGMVRLEARKGERSGRVGLNINEDEVRLALKEDPEVHCLGF